MGLNIIIKIRRIKTMTEEWHKVENGDLPKNSHLVVVKMTNGETSLGVYYKDDWRNFDNLNETLNDVNAWRELRRK